MIKEFNHQEKKILIAMMKFIASADGRLTDPELESFARIAEEKGFEDYHEIFNEVDRDIKSLDDISNLAKEITDKKQRLNIVKLAAQIATSDARIKAEEAEILKLISKEWNIDFKKIL